MIKKERKIPLKILQLEALLRRLPGNHPKYLSIQEDYYKVKAGFNGEKSMDYYFGFLPGNTYRILHDLRLSDGSRYYQIDSLIISPNFILIAEIKNFTGNLFFDHHFRQFTRTNNNEEESFPNPLFQVERQKKQLRSWMQSKKLPNVPIEYLLIFSNSSAIIKTSNPNLPEMKKIIHSGEFLNKIEGLEKKYTAPALNDKQILKLTKNLIKEHTPISKSILEVYKLTYNDLIKGVFCPDCSHYSNRDLKGKWKCTDCGSSSSDSYLNALIDFALLIDTRISNKTLREYLNLPSRNTASYILKRYKLSKAGNTKGSVYNLSELIDR